jgi:hypothetical protein
VKNATARASFTIKNLRDRVAERAIGGNLDRRLAWL